MHPCDLRIDVFRGGPGTPVNVRITHLPTGLWAASTDVSQIRAREQAKALLAAKLAEGPLGFDEQRMLEGERQAEAGQHRPLTEVLAEIRKRGS